VVGNTLLKEKKRKTNHFSNKEGGKGKRRYSIPKIHCKVTQDLEKGGGEGRGGSFLSHFNRGGRGKTLFS